VTPSRTAEGQARPGDGIARAAVVAVGLVAIAGVAMFAWSFWWEPNHFEVARRELSVAGWPADCDGLSVAVLSDLHIGSPWNGLPKLSEIVDATNAASPDLILLPGDFVIHGVIGGSFVSPEQLAPILARLDAPLGTFAVLGNHDWWFDGRRVRRALEDVGIPVLDDRARSLAADSCRFWLAGVSDFWEAPHDVEAALRGVPDSAAVLAFTHNPDVFPEVPQRVILTIAGHTHGGQVLLPFFGRPRVPSRYGDRYAIGSKIEGGRTLFVSSGLGTSIIPVRFRVPPEISLLRLGSP
jgi:hypothetical protein